MRFIISFIWIFVLGNYGGNPSPDNDIHFHINMGKYRDDGLLVTNLSNRKTENLKKQICKVFSDNGLRIEITANKNEVDFLDVTFNLSDDTYKPYQKPNNKLLYVNSASNHPPQILKNILLRNEARLSLHELKFNPRFTSSNRKRSRNIVNQ